MQGFGSKRLAIAGEILNENPDFTKRSLSQLLALNFILLH
jgi:hypothetical protein